MNSDAVAICLPGYMDGCEPRVDSWNKLLLTQARLPKPNIAVAGSFTFGLSVPSASRKRVGSNTAG